MRVNARFDEVAQEQLNYLTQATGHSVSQVVRESVAQYYAQFKRKQVPSRFLALAGTGDSGLTDVSANTKPYFAQAMAQKYPQHTGASGKAVSKKSRPARAE